METYVAFLRGINVGGNGLIKMIALKECLSRKGLEDVRTYIQSGNVIFRYKPVSTTELAKRISAAIHEEFDLIVAVAVFKDREWKKVIMAAPAWWGKDKSWKHNLLIMTEASNTNEAAKSFGALKSEIESIAAGNGVIYQSISWKYFGRATSGKLASLPIYKKMTIRSYNTAIKLVALLP